MSCLKPKQTWIHDVLDWKEKPINITLSESVPEVVKEKWDEYGFKDAFSYKA